MEKLVDFIKSLIGPLIIICAFSIALYSGLHKSDEKYYVSVEKVTMSSYRHGAVYLIWYHDNNDALLTYQTSLDDVKIFYDAEDEQWASFRTIGMSKEPCDFEVHLLPGTEVE